MTRTNVNDDDYCNHYHNDNDDVDDVDDDTVWFRLPQIITTSAHNTHNSGWFFFLIFTWSIFICICFFSYIDSRFCGLAACIRVKQ